MPTKIGCVNATLLFLFLSFGAQLIGFCIPGWLHIIILTPNPLDHPEKSISKNFALWYVVICWKEVCLTKSYSQLKQDRIDSSENKYAFHDDWNELNDYDYSAKYSKFPFSRLLEFQIEAVSALVVAFMGLVHMRIQKKRLVQYMSGKREEEPKQSTYCMVFCYSIISGGLVLVPASKFLEVNKDLKTVADNYIVGIPYALICSGIGGILALFSCLMNVGSICMSISSDEFNSEMNEERRRDRLNLGTQLVPLVALENQTTTRGYVDPIVPGYETRFNNGTRAVLTISHSFEPGERRGIAIRQGRERNSLQNINYSSAGQDLEEPPPSYEECMKQYRQPP